MKKSVFSVLFISGVSLFLSGCKEDKQPERDAVQELAEIMLDEKQKAEERWNYEMCTIDAVIAKKDIDETCGKK